jgi:hypothetical protein
MSAPLIHDQHGKPVDLGELPWVAYPQPDGTIVLDRPHDDEDVYVVRGTRTSIGVAA